VTSIEQELGRGVPMAEVEASVERAFTAEFGTRT